MSDDIRKFRFGRWRLGWKVDAREGMHIRKPFVSRPVLTCGCWRVWIGRLFVGRNCACPRNVKQYGVHG